MKSSLLERDLDAELAGLSAEESGRLAKIKKNYGPHFAQISSLLYERLPSDDRKRFIIWFAKRWGGIDRVSADELAAYSATIERIRTHPYARQEIDGQEYKCLDLTVQGAVGELVTYPWMLGVHDFYFDQYQHGDFRIRPGDTIIDAGAFVGDTAVLFHALTHGDCDIHAFEVLAENLKLLRHNIAANGIDEQITICDLALSTSSGQFVHIKAPAVQGATSIFGGPDGTPVETISIDDYVSSRAIERVDLIKMDIEGAERLALQGAMQTIRRDRPRLAICIYHLWDDMIEIPGILASIGADYNYGFKWVELRNGWEAVLLAAPKAAH